MSDPTGTGNHSTRKATKERFVIVPEWIIDAEISALAVRTWAVLRSYADNQTGLAWPSRSTIAKRCGVSVDSVDRALKELVKARTLKIIRRRGKNGEPLTNLFRLVIHTQAAPKRAPSRKSTATSSRKGTARTRPIGTITQLTDKSTDPLSVDYTIEHLLSQALDAMDVTLKDIPPTPRRHLA